MNATLITLFALGCAQLATAQSQPDERVGFVTTLGRDTVALESFTRTASRLEGDIVVRIPGTVRMRYAIDLTGSGAVSRSMLEFTPSDVPGVAARKVSLVFRGDSAQLTTDSAGKRREQMIPAGDLAPVFTTGFGSSFGLYASLGMYELLLSHFPLRVGEKTRVPTIGVTSGRAQFKEFIRQSATRVDVDYFGMGWTHLGVDERGRIVSADARETTEQVASRRTEYIDIDRAATEYAARDRAGQALGVASPTETVRASVGPAAVRLTFGSPRTRGREILGIVVPYDKVWRTGANAATIMELGRDVTIGGTKVPTGTYTLWTLPTKQGVTLIINGEHGQWGVSYNSTRDVVRVPMTVSSVETPQEKFAIAVGGSDGAQALRIMWDRFVWSVPIAP